MFRQPVYKRKTKLEGQTFGNWEVIRFLGMKGRGIQMYDVKCLSCGNFYIRAGGNIKQSTRCVKCIRTVLLNDPKCKEKHQELAWRTLYRAYQRSANARGNEFRLSLKMFKYISKQNCTYCGAEPAKRNSRGRITDNTATVALFTIFASGIDRKHNDIGYIPANCVPCCKTCNRAKSNMSYKGFIEWVDNITNYQWRLK